MKISQSGIYCKCNPALRNPGGYMLLKRCMETEDKMHTPFSTYCFLTLLQKYHITPKQNKTKNTPLWWKKQMWTGRGRNDNKASLTSTFEGGREEWIPVQGYLHKILGHLLITEVKGHPWKFHWGCLLLTKKCRNIPPFFYILSMWHCIWQFPRCSWWWLPDEFCVNGNQNHKP